MVKNIDYLVGRQSGVYVPVFSSWYWKFIPRSHTRYLHWRNVERKSSNNGSEAV